MIRAARPFIQTYGKFQLLLESLMPPTIEVHAQTNKVAIRVTNKDHSRNILFYPKSETQTTAITASLLEILRLEKAGKDSK